MKREKWMKRGTKVTALQRTGVITHCYTYPLNAGEYVRLINVRCEDGKKRKYHPDDVKPI